MTEPIAEDYPPEHPRRPNGEPYQYGGYAFLRLKCRCSGCIAAQTATAKKANKAAAKKTAKPSRASTARSAVAGAGPSETAVSVVTDLAEHARSRAKSSPGGAPQKDLEDFVGQMLVYLSIAFVWAGSRGLNLPTAVIDELALADDEAEDIAAPLARMFAGTELNGRYGKQITENADVPVALFTAAMYGRRTSQALANHRRILLQQARREAQAHAPQPAQPAAPQQPPAEPAGGGEPGGGGEPAEAFQPPRPSYGTPFVPGSQYAAE